MISDTFWSESGEGGGQQRGKEEDIKAKIEQKTVAEQQEQWHSLEVRPGHFNTWAFVKKSQTNDLGL